VESEEWALAIRTGIDNANAFRAMWGEPPLTERVAWFASTAADVRFWSTQQPLLGSGAERAIVDLRDQ
jgi:hypothetical protein